MQMVLNASQFRQKKNDYVTVAVESTVKQSIYKRNICCTHRGWLETLSWHSALINKYIRVIARKLFRTLLYSVCPNDRNSFIKVF